MFCPGAIRCCTNRDGYFCFSLRTDGKLVLGYPGNVKASTRCIILPQVRDNFMIKIKSRFSKKLFKDMFLPVKTAIIRFTTWRTKLLNAYWLRQRAFSLNLGNCPGKKISEMENIKKLLTLPNFSEDERSSAGLVHCFSTDSSVSFTVH